MLTERPSKWEFKNSFMFIGIISVATFVYKKKKKLNWVTSTMD